MPSVTIGNSLTTFLPAGEDLTVVADAASSGSVVLMGVNAGDADQSTATIAAGSTTVFGPYADGSWFRIICAAGFLTYTPDRIDPLSQAKISGTVPLETSAGVGAKNGATVSVAEYGDGVLHKTVLTLTATPITLTDEAGAGQYGGVKLYDFPAGNIVTLGAVIDADITLTGAQWLDTAEGDVGLGTTAVTNADALATTEQNIIATTPVAALVAQVGAINAQSADMATLGAAGATDSDLYINVRIDDNAAHTTSAGTISGTVTVVWVNAGDF